MALLCPGKGSLQSAALLLQRSATQTSTWKAAASAEPLSLFSSRLKVAVRGERTPFQVHTATTLLRHLASPGERQTRSRPLYRLLQKAHSVHAALQQGSVQGT